MKLKIITLFLCCFSLVSAWSQSIISGTVTDESKMPLIGVSILIKGTSTGSATDFDGNFNIRVEKGQVISFSYVGYKTKEVTINAQKTINITLSEDASQLDEVVIVGYGRQKKESVLAAISQVKGEQLLESGSPNLSNALSSIAPGVNVVQTSGQPGEDAGEIFIRGNSDPLILVDGVEIVGGFSNIDPRDVENMSILKDGAATAVYGIKGANGVIIITTKRGKIGKPKVSFSSEYAVKKVANTPDMLNAYDAQSILNQGILNDQAYLSGYSTEEDLAHWRDGDLPYIYPNTDWQDVIMKDYASSFNQTVSLQGGTEFVKYYASAGYLQEGDIIKTEQLYNYDPSYKFERYSFRGNLDFKITNTTRLKTSVSSRFEDKNNPGTNGNSVNLGFLRLYDSPPGGVVPVYPAEVMEQYPDPLYPGLAEARFGTGSNMYANLNTNGSYNSNKTVFSMDFELEQDLDFLTKGLMFIGKYNYISSYETGSRIAFDSSIQARMDSYTLLRDGSWFSFEGRNYERPYEYILGDENTSNNQDIAYYRAQLAYNRSFGKHNVTGMALFSRNKSTINTSFPYFNEDWVGRATYNYNLKYFLEFSGSYNGDETFAEGYRYKFFPSISAGINLAKESFIADNFPVLNNFKIRYSYGQTGDKSGLKIANTNPAQYNRWQYLSNYDYDTNRQETWRYFFGENNNEDPLIVVGESQVGNPTLTWATVTKQNIGVDFGLFKNKISGSVEFFKDSRDGLISRLTSANVPLIVGSSAALPFVNFGASESQGYDLSLTYKNRTDSGFSYSITGIYGFYENRVLESAADGPGTPEYTKIAGKPKGTTALLQTDGYFQNIDEVLNYPDFSGNPGLGDYRYIDYNANGTVIGDELEDQVRFDLPKAPKHSFSVNLSGSYNNWSMSAVISGISGHQGVINSTLAYALPSGEATGRYDQLDYWTATNTDAAYPALHATDNPNLSSATTARIIDLDYIKLRSLNIGYNFDMSNSTHISSLKVYLSGNNLFTISDIDYGDPEGNKIGSYPVLSRYNVGLNVSF